MTLCNEDNICDGFENYYTCPLDCDVNAEDDTCITFDDNLCDPDCFYDVDCTNQGTSEIGITSYLIWIITGILILTITLIIIIYVRKKNN